MAVRLQHHVLVVALQLPRRHPRLEFLVIRVELRYRADEGLDGGRDDLLLLAKMLSQ